MGFDITNLDDSRADGSIEAELATGDVVEIHYRQPDPYEWVDYAKSSMTLSRKMREIREAIDPETGEVVGDYSPTTSDDYQPVLDFLHEHTVDVDGLEDDGEPAEWGDLDDGQQRALLRLVPPNDALELVGTIRSDARLDEDEGNS